MPTAREVRSGDSRPRAVGEPWEGAGESTNQSPLTPEATPLAGRGDSGCLEEARAPSQEGEAKFSVQSLRARRWADLSGLSLSLPLPVPDPSESEIPRRVGEGSQSLPRSPSCGTAERIHPARDQRSSALLGLASRWFGWVGTFQAVPALSQLSRTPTLGPEGLSLICHPPTEFGTQHTGGPRAPGEKVMGLWSHRQLGTRDQGGSPAPQLAHRGAGAASLQRVSGTKSEPMGESCPWWKDPGLRSKPGQMLLNKCLIDALSCQSLGPSLPAKLQGPYPPAPHKQPSDPVLLLSAPPRHRSDP